MLNIAKIEWMIDEEPQCTMVIVGCSCETLKKQIQNTRGPVFINDNLIDKVNLIVEPATVDEYKEWVEDEIDKYKSFIKLLDIKWYVKVYMWLFYHNWKKYTVTVDNMDKLRMLARILIKFRCKIKGMEQWR